MAGLQQKFIVELQIADEAQKSIQAALGRQQVRALPMLHFSVF
jgi:hypothetical protein